MSINYPDLLYNVDDKIHRSIILNIVPERYEIGICGPRLIIFDDLLMITLFIPCAPVISSHDWSINLSNEWPETDLNLTNGCEDI